MANERLVNSVSVGVVFVAGPGDYAISNDEKIHVLAEVQDGLDQMAANEPDANISWSYNSLSVNLPTFTPWAGANWPGLPEDFYRGMDAALWSKKNDRVYFFKGSQYVRVNPNNAWKAEAGYPKPIAGNWPGFPANFQNGVDAAIWNHNLDKVYFFKGSEYIRVDPNNAWNVEAGYPKPIAGNWPGMPADFATGIDAAFWATKNNRVYIFKGDKYVRVNPNAGWNVEAGYPKPIDGNWNGLNDSFKEGIDAALMCGKNDKLYFFKKNRIVGNYVRIDPNAGWNVENGYPKPIGVGWSVEDQWRDPALQRLGYDTGKDGVIALSDHLKGLTNSQFGFVAFFTKLPSVWMGYANSSWQKIVMYRSADSGPSSFETWTSIDRIMAHETGHIFHAADEYSSSNCKCDSKQGAFIQTVNGNCANCDGTTSSCLMKNNTLGTVCDFSRLAFGWGAFLTKIDASFYSFKNDKFYLFSNEYYIRYSKDFKIDEGYPKLISEGWQGMPNSFAQGIDAILWSGKNNKVYVFKGNQYLRIDPNNNWQLDAGYPKNIAGNWNVPANFTSDLDAALWNDKSDKVYLFKGNQFVRLDPNNNWNMDPGYPKPIAGNWPGMPADFANGIDAATWSKDNNRVYMFKGTRYVRINPNNSWNVDSGYPNWINNNWKIAFPTLL